MRRWFSPAQVGGHSVERITRWAAENGVMDNTICYLNTDLVLTSPNDLTELATIFESQGIVPLHVTRGDDGLWYATFETYADETHAQHTEPEPNIAVMVAVVESLGEAHRSVWQGCTRREFNIGYDCGAEPWAFNQGLSCALLGRIAAVGASLRFTLYPNREPNPSCQAPAVSDRE
jgi:hypothetical protein